ncbi:O-methyltransferase [Ornithinimicrobium sp. INDO-MA30-4]|uniref:O-methyltransferase n=1 Tax=Ornithinimicrobium sp. INDO-MA30-4 TaxID=2908651 RepID=UPI001F1A8AF0|nr:O-methyltransferase [Ornithinimicrobium sp. INDO-MA30-4]UJH69350.1 O-methyltransferase [Ornithinimicrobium sp. INDO-MA30-4]
MSVLRMASWSYSEDFVGVPPLIDEAGREGAEMGAAPVKPAVGSALRLLAAAGQAKHVVEVGTGAGASGLWLLEGMSDTGILTTIDIEPGITNVARRTFRNAGIPSQRTRLINGDANDVLPRLTDAAYDLVFIDADIASYQHYVDQSIRLLRPGGVLLIDNMLYGDRVADPAIRDKATVLVRDLGKSLRDDERLQSTLLPVGDGLFSGIRQ